MGRARHAAIQSMTGYGRSTTHTALGGVTVELRSTNHRYLEIEQRLPSGLAAFQGRLTEVLRRAFRRGRVEVLVVVQNHQADQRRVTFDERLLRRYYETLLTLKAHFGLKGPVTLEHLLALPHAVTIAEDRASVEQLWEPIRQAAQGAIRELIRAREREGTRLVADLRQQLQMITRHLRRIRARQPKALARQRRLLRERLKELVGSKVAGSLGSLGEVASLVRDADIHEELVRIESHLEHMRQTLARNLVVGKQLDFIAQELMRETNTIGAKVSDAQATRQVVELKGCVERIREQVQNLE
jgi:uncharacterized protein (TIGR00255 family)